MSSYAGRCYYCGKHVMHKTLFGTLHICVTSEERHKIDGLQSQQKANGGLRALLKNNPQIAEAIASRRPTNKSLTVDKEDK